jgi:hypothetical protein
VGGDRDVELGRELLDTELGEPVKDLVVFWFVGSEVLHAVLGGSLPKNGGRRYLAEGSEKGARGYLAEESQKGG